MIFHFGRSISICPHRLGVLLSRRRVSPLLRPVPWPRVEISSKDPESSRFMKFPPTTVWMGEICPCFFVHIFSISIGSCSSTVSQHSFDAAQHPNKSRRPLQNWCEWQHFMFFLLGLSQTQNYFKTGPSKCRELELHGYLSMVKNDLLY